MDSPGKEDFFRSKHIKFFTRCLQILPDRYASLDTTRMTVAFFAISGLDVLDALHVLDNDKESYINWIYSLQVLPNSEGSNLDHCGFRGSATCSTPDKNNQPNGECGCSNNKYDSGHIAMTYSALLSLLILGDDLSRVNKRAVLAGVRALQQSDGSFSATLEGSENDMRFVYCAACICYVLDDFSGMNQELAISFIKNSLSYEGAFAQAPNLEAHGGTTFCAVAALVLMSRLESVLTPRQLSRLKRWCISRQQSGFQGRPNKPVDTCYSFWLGGTLQLLGIYNMTDPRCNRGFLVQTQDSIVGGFAKWIENSPDALHAYFGVCGLSLLGEPGLQTMDPALNITARASQHLHLIQGKQGGGSVAHSNGSVLRTDKHQQYFQQCLAKLSADHTTVDTSRLTVAHLAVSALELLNSLHTIHEDRDKIIDWIYSLQVVASSDKDEDKNACMCGFRGSSASRVSNNIPPKGCSADCAHIAMTYSALCTLLTLGDDLKRVQRGSIIAALRHLQLPSGSFSAMADSSQSDMKFTYCAVCISYMLNDWSGINVQLVTEYIVNSLSHEGGFGQGPGLEAHGGATYCAIASLVLLGQLDSALTTKQRDGVQRWCLRQQSCGFQGRTNKQPDSSYCFWLTATLQMLDSLHLANNPQNRQFLLECQHPTVGSFGAQPNHIPDALHGYLSLSALSLSGESNLKEVYPALNISDSAAQHMHALHQQWTKC